ncbi:hypothetical protein C5167_044417 [Papaver somniferum]|uniref:Uncharacterized protein n=1 Tax=Papaver somniferum TaxID=3469 RepID=A0A4Y7LCC5_PAPSO|nr:hypothetical protein C5167_044417 [Papaver somniferum]
MNGLWYVAQIPEYNSLLCSPNSSTNIRGNPSTQWEGVRCRNSGGGGASGT